METLEQEIKELIINALNLEDIEPNDINSDEPLFVEGLGLDSIDALELGLAIRKKFNISIDADSEQTKKHFASVRSLIALIEGQCG